MKVKEHEAVNLLVDRLVFSLLSIIAEKTKALDEMTDNKIFHIERDLKNVVKREIEGDNLPLFRSLDNEIIILSDTENNFLCSNGLGSYYLSRSDFFNVIRFVTKSDALYKKSLLRCEKKFSHLLPTSFTIKIART